MLHFFGCSMTYGADLNDRYNEYYPYLISKELGEHYHCYAREGNDDFTSLDTFTRMYLNGYINDEDTVFFQWSGMTRHGILFEDSLVQYPWLETLNGKWDKLSKGARKASKEYKKYVNDQKIIDVNLRARKMFTKVFSLLPFRVINIMGWKDEEFSLPLEKPTGEITEPAMTVNNNTWVEKDMITIGRPHIYNGHLTAEGMKVFTDYLLTYI